MGSRAQVELTIDGRWVHFLCCNRREGRQGENKDELAYRFGIVLSVWLLLASLKHEATFSIEEERYRR